MQSGLIEFLTCPVTGKNLDILEIKVEKNWRIETGILFTEDGYAYPIINGVPRLIEGAMKLFEKDLYPYKEIWDKINPNKESFIQSEEFKRLYLPTLRQFEKEWRNHKLDGKTWGWDQQDRLKKYMEYMAVAPEDYSGKRILDLGAGTGQFTCTISSELKCNVIGVDLSPAVEIGERLRREKYPETGVNFIQANLMALPFRSQSFDYVHASGVLHHTPDTKKAFDKVESLIKAKGKYGVWIYRNTKTMIPLIPFVNSKFTDVDADAIRPVTSKMNPGLLYALIYGYSTVFHLFYKLNQLVRGIRHEQSIRERTTSLFDTLAPSFVHKHEVDDVKSWFVEKNYRNLVETDQQNVAGFNVTGEKSGV